MAEKTFDKEMPRMRHAARMLAATAGLFLMALPAVAAPRLEVSPTTFDFGWAPDNAKITAEFTVFNTGDEMVPLTALKPTCGCTATNFEPDGLASREQKKIALTFNTRGYTNMAFNKMAKLKTDLPENAYTVYLTGHVLKPDNGLIPDSNGIAAFEKGSDRRAKIKLTNKTLVDAVLTVVQPPAPWAKVKFSPKPIKPGESTEIDISVDGSLEEPRDTSVTFASSDPAAPSRVTIAIRTGPPPPAYRAYAPPTASQPAGKPSASPAK
jgi:hypothetical protein